MKDPVYAQIHRGHKRVRAALEEKCPDVKTALSELQDLDTLIVRTITK